MARIPEQTIEQIRNTADILDVISEYVILKQRGANNSFGLCPFHNEKTPSFSVNTNKQIFKCFGCGKGGGTINFIMEIEHLDFVDAMKFLAKKYGIEIKFNHTSKSSNDLFNQLYEINLKTCEFYSSKLNDNILLFLKNRNISTDSIATFQLGYSPKYNDSLLNELRAEAFSSEALQKSGLFVDIENKYIDRFRDRIMFPINNNLGKVIGFAGRIHNKKKIAKYVNSPETPLYHKSKILYGLNITRHEIIKKQAVIVVEGYFDLMQLYQADIKNTVAISGTAFTEDHAHNLSKLCKKIYLAYDGDDAGISAMIRAGYIISKHNLEALIIKTPENIDPDDWIQKEGAQPFLKAMNNAQSLIRFHYELENDSFTTNQDKINFINGVMAKISEMENPLNQEAMLKELSGITQMSWDSIINTFKNLQKTKNTIKTKKSDENQKNEIDINYNNISTIERELIMFCLVSNVKTRKLFYKHVDREWIKSEMILNIFSNIYIHLTSDENPNAEIIMNELKIAHERDFFAQLVFDSEKINVTASMAKDCLCRLEGNVLQEKIDKLRNNLNDESNSQEQAHQIVKEIDLIQKNKNSLLEKYSNV